MHATDESVLSLRPVVTLVARSYWMILNVIRHDFEDEIRGMTQ